MSFKYRIYCCKTNDEDEQIINDFGTQLEVIDYLLQNGIKNVQSIWKVSSIGSLCMYEKTFRSSMTSETYYKNYTTLSQYDRYKLDDRDHDIMKMCD
jgi:hypothetical protein